MKCSKILISLFTIAVTVEVAFGDAPIAQYGPPGYPSNNRPPAPSYGPPGGGGNPGYGGGEEGGKPEPFNFEYEVKDAQSGNDFGHRASSDGNKVTGQYHVLLPDGRNQIVDYTADDNGYNANVKYEGEANPSAGGNRGGYSTGGQGGSGGYPSGGQGGPGGYPSGAPSGPGGYPSGGPSGSFPSSGGGYPSGGPPSSSYLPPGK